MENVLVMFSGGKDSLYSAILMLEQGYKVNLVHYSTLASCYEKNVKNGYKRLVNRYGNDNLKYLGVINTSGFFRKFIAKFYNEHIDEISKKYGDIKISELNCLLCRSSMYIASIIIAKQNNIKYIVDGARKSQLFAIEQDDMLNLFSKLFLEFDIKILYPLKDYVDDFDLKNELLIRGLVPKVAESQCLIGMPISNCDDVSIMASKKIYQEVLHDMIIDIVNEYKDISLGDKLL